MARVANADLGLEAMYSARYLKCLVILVQVFFCTAVYAGHAYFEERREIALMRCLNYNYSNLGVYEVNALKDYSVWTYKLYADYKFSLDGSIALNDFIEKNAGIFIRKDSFCITN